MTTWSSSVTWTLVLTFIFGGLNEILSIVPSGWAVIISAVIAGIGIYLHKGQIAAGVVARAAKKQ